MHGESRSGVGDGVLVGEVVLVPEVLVELAGKLSGAGAEGGASALKEEDGDEAALGTIGVGGEPTEAGSIVGTGAGFAEDGQLVEVGTEAASGSVFDCAGHAILHFRNVFGDVESPLDLGGHVGGFVGGGGVLEVVEGSAIGDGGDEGTELEGGE